MASEPMSEERLAELERELNGRMSVLADACRELVAEVRRLRDLNEWAQGDYARYQDSLYELEYDRDMLTERVNELEAQLGVMSDD